MRLATLLTCATLLGCPTISDDDTTPASDDDLTDDDSPGDDDTDPTDDDSVADDDSVGDDDSHPGDDDSVGDDDSPPLDGDGDGVPPPADCDDADPNTFPGAEELCDGLDNDCSGAPPAPENDGDSDGVPACEGDCDDLNPDRTPGMAESCDGQDNDCDPATDETVDADGDGMAVCGGDCDDTDAAVFPGAIEFCSGIELDCDLTPPGPCATCQELLATGHAADGVYAIDGDGSGPEGPYNVYCDMTTGGGGWTLLMRTVWDWSMSQSLMGTSADWRVANPGNAAPGSAFRLPGDLWDDVEVGGDHMLALAARDGVSELDCEWLRYTWAGGTLAVDLLSATLTGLTGPLADHLVPATTLSATDLGPAVGCTQAPFHGVPFFYLSCCETCFTIQSTDYVDAPHPMSSLIDQPDLTGLTAATACPSGGALPTAVPIHSAVNVIEYYVR